MNINNKSVIVTIIILIVCMIKPMHRQVKQLPEALTARKWSQDLTIGSRTPEPELLTSIFRTFLVMKIRTYH